MYDFTAAIFYFLYAGFYLLYILENKRKYLVFSLIMIGLSSLSRFSISMGLAGIYMMLTSFTYKRSPGKIIRDGIFITLSVVLFNLPWLIGQTITHGSSFFWGNKDNFIYDNFGRYLKEPWEESKVYRDYYSFFVYTLVGMLPHMFILIATFFHKNVVLKVKEDRILRVLLAGFVPCLLIFSFSGHVKLVRYIAYVFPFIAMFLGYNMYRFNLADNAWRKRSGRIALGTMIFIGLWLAIIIFQFSSQSKEGWLLVLGIIFLLFFTTFVMYRTIKRDPKMLLECPQKLLIPIGIAYLILFSILTYESFHVSFLVEIREGIMQIIR